MMRKWIETAKYECSIHCYLFQFGRAIVEAVSLWLPTASARVQSRVWSSGICGGQRGVGAGFLRVLRFPLPFIPPNTPSSGSPGQVQEASEWPTYRVDTVWTPHPAMQIKKKLIITKFS
jgi:hypothetical protein